MISLAESMKNYLNEYVEEFQQDSYVSIDWLSQDVNFSISANPLGKDGTLQRDVVGNRLMGYSIMFSALFDYSSDIQESIENSLFFEKLIDWIEDNNKNKVYPQMNEGLIPQGVYVQQTPYLYNVDPDNQMAQYSIILQLQYKKGR